MKQEPQRATAGLPRSQAEEDVNSDHYHPWLEVQGHSGYAWSVLGAAAQATERIPLMTYVTAPIIRYHPVVVAQKAATMALLSDGRFTLGLGAGERLNEHVVGHGWPPVGVRHQMLAEAVEVIRRLWDGGWVSYHGSYFDAASRLVRSEDVAELVPCGPNVDAIVAAVGKFVDAGFTHVALVQVGDAQRELCDAYAGKLGAALREL